MLETYRHEHQQTNRQERASYTGVCIYLLTLFRLEHDYLNNKIQQIE